MKNIFTIGFTIALGGVSFAQDLEFHENGVAISGTVITIDSSETCDHTLGNYYIVNKTSGPLTISWSRTRAAHMSPYTDQICDDILCFDASNTTVYQRPTTMTVAAGDSTVFQPKVYPYDTPGCAIYTYKAYTGLGTFQDSIQVKYRFGGQDCFLETPTEEIVYSVYPNPASDQLNIKLNTGGNAVQLKLFNIMGELVMKTQLVEGNNTVSLNDLTNGIYFYSIVKNGEVVETRKLIIKH
ncbi:MAG: T9SS type A sorting domain-containing protein [Crocinitomicaceae bacterium]|nr:T9SS type A sorting domain-containing protein [Crocinitomicaceae bacterium]